MMRTHPTVSQQVTRDINVSNAVQERKTERKAKAIRWRFFYLAGMPAEICGGNELMTTQQAASFLREEYPGQRDAFLDAIERGITKVGSVWQGNRFVAVRVR